MDSPTPSQVQEYALYLGLDPVHDQDLLYLAVEGLQAPLSPPWQQFTNEQGVVFYFNPDTQQSSWEHPSDAFYQQKAREMKAAKLKRTELHHKNTHLQTQNTENRLIEEEKGTSNSQERLKAFEFALNEELNTEKERIKQENMQKIAIFEEKIRKEAENEAKLISNQLDLELKALENEKNALFEAEKLAKTELKTLEFELIAEKNRFKSWKQSQFQCEVEKEKSKYAAESLKITSEFELKSSELDLKSEKRSDFVSMEREIRERVESHLAQEVRGIKENTDERVHQVRREMHIKLDRAATQAQEGQQRLADQTFSEQKRLIDLAATQELVTFQRQLDYQFDQEKLQIDLNLANRMKIVKKKECLEENELKGDGEMRVLTVELEKFRDLLRVKQNQLRDLLSLQEEMKTMEILKRNNRENRLKRMENDLEAIKKQLKDRKSVKKSASKSAIPQIKSLPRLQSENHLHEFEELRLRTENRQWPSSIQSLMEEKVRRYGEFLREERTNRIQVQGVVERQSEWLEALRSALV